ncbi:hypothetical protein [Dermabacter hominis]|uniref:hypothetical protein n=1 Tax=Dermabacter hominis TaxID=36740 RepID=UPI00242B22AE|nr:hypothetical protein [Dermabacter hominis]
MSGKMASEPKDEDLEPTEESGEDGKFHGFLILIDSATYATLRALADEVTFVSIAVTVVASILLAYTGYELLLKEDKKFSQGGLWLALVKSLSVALGTSLVTSVCTRSIVLTVISLVAAIVFELLLLGWNRL